MYLCKDGWFLKDVHYKVSPGYIVIEIVKQDWTKKQNDAIVFDDNWIWHKGIIRSLADKLGASIVVAIEVDLISAKFVQ